MLLFRMAHLQTAVNAFKGRLNVERTRFLNEFREAKERLQLGRHRIQERRRKDIHALHIGESKLMGFLTIYSGLNTTDGRTSFTEAHRGFARRTRPVT